jgi:hypothetical protein
VSINAFLSALPAILGILGFVVYQFLKSNSQGDQITKKIVEKIRSQAPEIALNIQGLSPAQLDKKLELDHEINRLVGKQDYQLLKQALRQQFLTTLTVFIICGTLFIVGLSLFAYTSTRPEPLRIDQLHLESVDPEAKGLAVDLDDLRVTWSSTGKDEDVGFQLQNPQTGRTSELLRTSSREGKIIFARKSYEQILDDRELRESNRVRILCQTSKKTFVSDEFQLKVGIQVLTFYDPARQTLETAALIDNSSIPNYIFEAKIIVWRRRPKVQPVSHVGEGKPTDAASAREFAMLVKHDDGFLHRGVSIIHGVALGKAEFEKMAKKEMGLIWSPRSNIELYGATTDVRSAKAAGVMIALAPDWSPSGSDGIIQELNYAATWNAAQPSPVDPTKFGLFTDKELVQMVTVIPAHLAAVDQEIGSLAPGRYADLLLIRKNGADPYQALIHASPADVRLVMINGVPLYGDADLMEKVSPRRQIEIISVCGRPKALYMDPQSGVPETLKSFKQISQELDSKLNLWGGSLSPLAICNGTNLH